MKKFLITVFSILAICCTFPLHADDNPSGRACKTGRDGTNVGHCDGLKQGDRCEDRVSGSKVATCKPNGCGGLTCTSTRCQPGWYLWFHDGNSMGVCRTPEMAKKYCDNPKYCKTHKCKPVFTKKMYLGEEIDANTGCAEEITPAESIKVEPTPAPVTEPSTVEQPETPPVQPEPSPEPPVQTDTKPDLPAQTTDTNKTPAVISANCTTYSQCHSTTIFESISVFLDTKFTPTTAWKTDDGKFNMARLASDSIAGVVLGTVGGVITSSVIKKNQIKNGFEDLKCTIAGQNVATYGDEFNVSVK